MYEIGLRPPRSKPLFRCVFALVLFFRPTIAFAQEEKPSENVPYREFIHAHWVALSEVARWIISLVSFGLAAWLIGGCILGYLIFSVRKQDALSSVRLGYGFGALLWTLGALFFMWSVLETRDPLWYLAIVACVAVFFGVVFGYVFRTQKAVR